MADEPLHVRTARALGCSPVWDSYYGFWRCRCPRPEEVPEGHWGAGWDHEKLPKKPRHVRLNGKQNELARYDESWYATGAWIERLGISLIREPHDGMWSAEARRRLPTPRTTAVSDSNPLVAVCRLIVHLAAEPVETEEQHG